jgi:hypothetical protein
MVVDVNSDNIFSTWEPIFNGFYISYDLTNIRENILADDDRCYVIFSTELVLSDYDETYRQAGCRVSLLLDAVSDNGWKGELFLPIPNQAPFNSGDDAGIRLGIGVYRPNESAGLISIEETLPQLIDNPYNDLKLEYTLYKNLANNEKYSLPTNITINDPNKSIRFDFSKLSAYINLYGIYILLGSYSEIWGINPVTGTPIVGRYFGNVTNSDGETSNYDGIIDTTNFYFSGNNIQYNRNYQCTVRLLGYIFCDENTEYYYVINDKRTDLSFDPSFGGFKYSIFATLTKSISLGSNTSDRPNNWEWTPLINTNAIIPFYNNTFFPVTADQWNAFWTRINEFREYRKLSSFDFTVAFGDSNKDEEQYTTDFTCEIYNEAVEAINEIYGYEVVTEITDRNDLLLANTYNSIKDALNAIT